MVNIRESLRISAPVTALQQHVRDSPRIRDARVLGIGSPALHSRVGAS